MSIRFSKPSGFLLSAKRSFFEDNDKHLAHTKRLAAIYIAQPKRTMCMACGDPLKGEGFVKGGVPYIFCATCDHLNGEHQDTPEYCAAVYGDEEMVAAYAGDEAAYRQRVNDIYHPKADHLIQSLRAHEPTPESLAFTDVGAGAGHFLAALQQRGAVRAKGCEISKGLCDIANERLGARVVLDTDAADMMAGVDVVTMIHALEHLPDPRGMMNKIKASGVRYLYVAIPLFSVSVYLEAAFSDVFPRHLSGGHTHLFTRRSLDRFCQEFGVEMLDPWHFGADATDMMRMIGLRQNGALADRWAADFGGMLDAVQSVFDHNAMASEIHFLAKINR